MTELFHNLTMQALDVENKKVNKNFDSITELCDSIKEKLRSNKVLMSNKNQYTFSEYTPPQFEPIRDRNQQFEDDVVRNKLSDTQVPERY